MENNNEKIVNFFRFEDLRIYHKSLDYNKWLHSAVILIPHKDDEGLFSRFEQSARSIALNIAEGSARNKSQFIYYLKMAKSCVRECVAYTAIASLQGYFNETNTEISRSYLMELTKMIGALVVSLQKVSNHPQDENDDEMED